eukprot:TRINITY_DN10899_c0_g2_i1.p1 TRINITY_DN10899_c0_g2~~TRINITY_DN10899_c0_g2_i1.p1  ORF type:complete len:286 (+),score=78.44 TRINITY_DN10899_c0_g2_i1:39-860(+)
MKAFKLLRSGLFVPGSNLKAMGKAISGATAADFVIVDLEDAVHPDNKIEARKSVLEHVVLAKAPVVVRINALDTKWGADDFHAVKDLGVPVLLPKVEDVNTHLPSDAGVELWAMVETARGVLNAPTIARSVAALVAGTQDLAADLRLPKPISPDRLPLLLSLSSIVLAARAANIHSFDAVHPSFKDITPLEAEAKQGASLGFTGKTCIHPAQVDTINACFSPSKEAVAAAEAIVAAWDAARNPDGTHPGIAVLKGQMIEELHVRDAKRILESY